MKPFSIVLGCLILLVCIPFVAAEAVPAPEVLDAVCRIRVKDGGCGTGCIFEIREGAVYVLTAAHVVEGNDAAGCEFWRGGHLSQSIAARVLWRNGEVDAAVLILSLAEFAPVVPAVIPLADERTRLASGESLVSAGCAQGNWATFWRGHVLTSNESEVRFVPPPANGRSGSPLLDSRGRSIVGLIRARTIEDDEGIAVSIAAIHAAFRKDTRAAQGRFADSQAVQAQCPGGTCPTPYLLPYRNREQMRNPSNNLYPSGNGAQGNWPSLPPSQGVDLSTTNEKLDRIAALLQEWHEEKGAGKELQKGTPPAEAPSQESAAEKSSAVLALSLAQEAQAQTAALSGEVQSTRQENSRLREAIEAVVGDQSTLKERFEDRLKKVKEELGGSATTPEIVKAYVKDYAAEKLSDGSLGMSIGKLLAGALGLSAPLAAAIGTGLWLVSRRLGSRLNEKGTS